MSRSASPHSDSHDRFDPAPHREQLVAIVRAIESLDAVDEGAIDRILRQHPRGGTGFFSRAELIAGFRYFAPV